MKQLFVISLVLGALVLTGCRGTLSDKPPIHPNPNMDFQEKFEAQEVNTFFEDRRAMRAPVPGTIARGFLKEDTRFYVGREADGSYVTVAPIPVTREVLLRGRERYNIYCTMCHGTAGDGQGIIMTGNYGYVPAPSYTRPDLLTAPDGYMYDVITNGVRYPNMPGYAQQISVADRWAITVYIRALQRSQNAAEGDIPPDVLVSLQQGRTANP